MDESSEKLPFNATKLFEALQYQLIIALDYCYKLRQGQRLWVEVYGDVTIEGDAQVRSCFNTRTWWLTSTLCSIALTRR
ncbi:hypothetical protein E0I00_28605 [Pseudomonas syringae pv. actinidiae]|nr:hypothetical protein [Pseudomonas syringae pv. actinidiae]